jgi:hypothetical protein
LLHVEGLDVSGVIHNEHRLLEVLVGEIFFVLGLILSVWCLKD